VIVLVIFLDNFKKALFVVVLT